MKTRVIYCVRYKIKQFAHTASLLFFNSPGCLRYHFLCSFWLSPLAQSTRPSLHSISLSAFSPFSGGFYLVSPCQLLQSDTGVPHFALDPLTHRCLLSLSPAADFAEPRPPPRHKHLYKIVQKCTLNNFFFFYPQKIKV